MAVHYLRLHSSAWLVGLAGLIGMMMASCESTHDSDRMTGTDPSGRGDPPSLSAGAERGKELFQKVGCMGCHVVNGQGGRVGPDLSDEGNAGQSRQWLSTQIRNPKSHDPQTAMPAFDNLSDQQVKDLVDYLESLKTGPARVGRSGPPSSSEAGAPSVSSGGGSSVVTTGGKMWGQTCGQCHNLRPPSEYSDAQWAVAVHHMRVRVPLTGEEQRDILAFLQASN
jgi:mono/diheme cytochrome c family protein